MTTEATLPTTAASPTARQVWTRARGIALALVLLLVGAVAIAVVRSDARHGELDPRSADPYGSRAVAELLADRGSPRAWSPPWTKRGPLPARTPPCWSPCPTSCRNASRRDCTRRRPAPVAAPS